MNVPLLIEPLIELKFPRLASPEFVSLVDLERQLADDLERQLRQKGIDVIRTDMDLLSKLKQGIAVFPTSNDHHHNAAGYQSIANTVWSRLGENGQEHDARSKLTE